MTTNHSPSPDAPLATIPVAQMETYIADGRAERWTQSIEDMVPVAALLDGDWDQHDDDGNRTWVLRSGTWYVVWDAPQAGEAEAEAVYELAPPELAAVLSDFLARLRTANDQVTQTDAQSAAQFSGEGEVVPSTPGSPEP